MKPGQLQRRAERRHCNTKVRHASRREAGAVLALTLGARDERMAPYPCKFCAGWHNGHRPLHSARDLDPRCSCGHIALTHDVFPGLGCLECRCLQHREWVYCDIIERERRRTEVEIRRRLRLVAILRATFMHLPRAWVASCRVHLRACFGPSR